MPPAPAPAPRCECLDVSHRNDCAFMAEHEALRDFVDRYRRIEAHGVTATGHGQARCFVCEADRLLGGETR